MKFKKISSLCNKAKHYVLYDKLDSAGKNTQWLGDGCAAYPLYGLPQMDEDSLCKMFDITEKQRNGMAINYRAWDESINANDTDPKETVAEEIELGIICKGRELIPLMGQDGIIFIDSKYMSPLEDGIETLQMYERKTEKGQIYIIVKAGLLIRAVISPVEPVNDKFVNQLQDMIRECRKAMKRPRVYREDGEGIDAPQITWIEVDE